MNHLSGFCLQIHYFSPIAFQSNALTLMSQCIKSGNLLETTVSTLTLSSAVRLTSFGPYPIDSKHR